MVTSERSCPKCRVKELKAEELRGLSLERCAICHGLRLDQGQLRALLAAKLGLVADKLRISAMAELMDPVVGHCFDCDVAMDAITTDTDIRLDQCPSCKVVFLDEGELATLQFQQS